MDIFEFDAICTMLNDFLFDNYTGDKVKFDPSDRYEMRKQAEREFYSGAPSGDTLKGDAPALAYMSAPVFDETEMGTNFKPQGYMPLESDDFNTTLNFYVQRYPVKTHAECKKRAYLPKGRYEQLRRGEKPTKREAMTLALALALEIDEAELLLKTAGYEFKSGELEDMIVKGLLDYQEFDVVVADDIFRKYGLQLLDVQPPIEY